MMDARDENVRTLMGISGISEDEAVKRLSFRAAISVGPGKSAAAFGRDISGLLGRTIQVVSEEDECDIELAIGCAPSTNAPLRLTMAVTKKEMKIDTGAVPVLDGEIEWVPGITRKVSSCYATGYVLARVIGGDQFAHIPDPFVLAFENLGLPAKEPSNRVILDDVVLVGRGASRVASYGRLKNYL